MKKSTVARNGLIAGGNWIVDQVKMIDVYPQPEQLTNIREQIQGTGGAPYNVLVDLAKAGAQFPLLAAGLVGKDAQGDSIIETCKQHRIDTRYLRSSSQAPTSYTDVMTELGHGRRTFFHNRGANALWDGSEIDFSKLKVKMFHLGYLLLLDALDGPDKHFGTKAARLLAKAQDAGVKTSVDVVSEDSGRYHRVVPPALKHADFCIINEIEAGRTAGFKVRGTDGVLDTVSLRHAAGALLQHGVQELVVIHFPEGAFARTRKGEDYWQSSLNVPAKRIAGTAGAGDAFCAGVLWGLHEGWDLPRCLFTGVCLAAACLSHATCTDGVGPLANALALVKRFKLRPPLEATS